jgi:hypothetical protein
MANPKRASLTALLAQAAGPQADAAPLVAVQPAPEGKAATPPARVGLYLDRAVAREIKLVAFTHDCKVHDIYMEAVDLVLKKYGRPSIQDLVRNNTAPL